MIDLRSDTVTRPSAGMKAAMASAETGDDSYGEDPSVRRLEDLVASLFGHAEAVFFPTATMANTVGLRLQCQRGEEVLADHESHVIMHESSSLSDLAGIQTRTITSVGGRVQAQDVARGIRLLDGHTVPTRVLVVEQPHTRAGGTIVPLGELQAIAHVAAACRVAVHCDGARIWNAHVASGVALRDYGALFDSITLCFSKGLGAPAGAALVMREPARRADALALRKRHGGSMRQSGVLAAAAHYGVRNNLARLAVDHERAREIAATIGQTIPEAVNVDQVETNVCVIDTAPAGLHAPEVARRCAEKGVLVSQLDPHRLRVVTHLDVSSSEATEAAAVISAALAKS